MAQICKSALVPFSAKTMYQLVNDVESYPIFLPDCSAAKIMINEDSSVIASITIEKSGIRQSFTTRNELTPNHTIKMNLVDGPFTTLTGAWTFEALQEDACKVVLDLNFEFSGKIMNIAFGSIFNHIANTMVDVFCQRAKDIYGK